METKINNWLEDEAKGLTSNLATYENLPSLKLTPNVITEIDIDFSKPFEKWNGENNGKPVTKKIIPITFTGKKMYWWLNVKNPVYKEIIEAGKNGITHFKVMQTGSREQTKYVLCK